MDLNPRQKKFCEYYASGMNATAAYIAAGFKKTNARFNAAKLITKDNISRYLTELASRNAQESIATAEELHKELTIIIRSKYEKTTDRIGAIKELHRMRNYDPPEKLQINGELTLREMLNELKDRDA